jgi:hypothetical protein
VKHDRTTPQARASAPARSRRRVPRQVALTALVALAAAALSGCGIRDTALPVDAGVAASRTACPPAPDATLSKLAKDASILPTRPVPAIPTLLPGPEASAAERAKEERPGSAPAEAGSTPAVDTPAASPGPTVDPTATATASDGTLSCLLVTGPPTTDAPTATPSPTASVTASP